MNKLATYTMERIQEILNTEILGNTVLAYIISLGIFIVLLLVVIIFHKIFVKRLKKIAAKTDNPLDDNIIKLIKKNFLPLLYFGAFYLAALNLNYISIVNKILNP